MDGYTNRLTALVEALEYHGHGTAIVSCQFGHEVHWPGPVGEYVPLHAGDLRDLLDDNRRLRALVADAHSRLSQEFENEETPDA